MRTRALLLISAMLALLSLGLPWQRSGLTPTFRTSWLTGFCGTPGAYVCDPGTIVFHNGFAVTGAVPGYASPMRVALLVALVLLIAGFRRASSGLLRLGLVVAAIGLVLGGTSIGGGQVAYLAALVVLILELRRSGRLRTPGESAATAPAQGLTAATATAPGVTG